MPSWLRSWIFKLPPARLTAPPIILLAIFITPKAPPTKSWTRLAADELPPPRSRSRTLSEGRWKRTRSFSRSWSNKAWISVKYTWCATKTCLQTNQIFHQEWVSSCLMAYQHNIGHSVPWVIKNINYVLIRNGEIAGKIKAISSSSGILPFLKNSRSMTPITWQAAVDDEEQRPLLQDILEAAIDDRRQVAVDIEEQRPQLQDIFEAAINGNHV